ncbi:MAG: 1-deoxy-D-xylulose-5-phosphate reductoisomerase [Patescibacteria group bacterium]
MSQVTRHKSIVILGSTGSVGTQTLEVLEQYRDEFEIVGLVAYQNEKLLQTQKEKFVNAQAILLQRDGFEKIESLIEKSDIVVNALSGESGIAPSIQALEKGKKLLIANKEALVVAGETLMKVARKNKTTIIPIDSELTGILECLGERPMNEVEKIILTCSGGPFHGKTREELENVTVAQALKHPRWNMGKKISMDSATLMNKGFELIAASVIFGIPQEKIEIVIHPESVVHALIQWRDGNITAAISPVDMRHTITYALFHPERKTSTLPRLDITKTQLTFQKPDEQIFRSLRLAREASDKGEKFSAALSQKNDEAIEKFLTGKIKFLEIFNLLNPTS